MLPQTYSLCGFSGEVGQTECREELLGRIQNAST
jgi:hypothetical protein